MNDAGPAPDVYRKLSTRAFLIILIVALAPWLFFVHRGEDARALVAALSVGAVGTILSRYRHRLAYWIMLSCIAVSHALFVLLIRWPNEIHGPGIVFAPLVIADIYAAAKLVIYAVEQSDR